VVVYQPAAACSDCGASSRTTGTTKACEAGRRRTVVARRVMVGSGQRDLRERRPEVRSA